MMIEKEDTTYQTVGDLGKAMLKGEFIAVNVYIKTEDSQINVIFHIKTKDEKELINQKHARGVQYKWNQIDSWKTQKLTNL